MRLFCVFAKNFLVVSRLEHIGLVRTTGNREKLLNSKYESAIIAGLQGAQFEPQFANDQNCAASIQVHFEFRPNGKRVSGPQKQASPEKERERDGALFLWN